MSCKGDILKQAEALNAIDGEKLRYNKNRLLLLLQRVKTVVDQVEKDVDESTRNLTVSQSLMMLSITLEEIWEYVILFCSLDQQLAAHIVKYGSDEEQFIKWNERLQHCAAELNLEIDVLDVFNETSDFHAFQKDVAILKEKEEMVHLIVLLHGKNNEKIFQAMDNLISHQTNVRSTYQSKTDPNAPMEINSKKVKYEEVIGHGGMITV
jgi:hypothetical protein